VEASGGGEMGAVTPDDEAMCPREGDKDATM
jgi:hypothetical protein